MLVKSKQPMLTVVFDVRDQLHEPLDHLFVSLLDVAYVSGAQVHLEPEIAKRMLPTAELWIYQDARVSISQTGYMCVVIDQSMRVDVVEHTLDKIIGGFGDPARQIFGCIFGSTSEEMK
jgi:hypothetical protein